MLDIPSDMTAADIPFHEERHGREETQIIEGARPTFDTVLLTNVSGLPDVRLTTPCTPTIAELTNAIAYKETPTDDAETRAHDARVTLLTRRYEGVSSPEDDARFRLLTERLRKLSPRIGEKDWSAVSSILGDLEGISANIDAVREKLGQG